jgi:D-citramalate synthase
MFLNILDFLTKQPIKRVLLPDNLGVLIPSRNFEFISKIIARYHHFDFHAHNDYDLKHR